MAAQVDEQFCLPDDVDKSLQLVFPTRTVDLVARDEEEASLLARGFQVIAQIYSTSERADISLSVGQRVFVDHFSCNEKLGNSLIH